jgi:hypothetical protein
LAQGGRPAVSQFVAFGGPALSGGRTSPDQQWEAYLNNYNVMLRNKGETKNAALIMDGSESNYYTLASLAWSPDSKYLAAYRVRPGYQREVQYLSRRR